MRRIYAFVLALVCSAQSMAAAAPVSGESVASIPVGEQLSLAVLTAIGSALAVVDLCAGYWPRAAFC